MKANNIITNKVASTVHMDMDHSEKDDTGKMNQEIESNNGKVSNTMVGIFVDCQNSTAAAQHQIRSENSIGQNESMAEESSMAPCSYRSMSNASTLSRRSANIKKRNKKWDQMYFHLKQFKRINGHCLVPNPYEEDRSLGIWVSVQRKQYKALVSGSTTASLSLKQARQLNEIGFVWAVETSGARSVTSTTSSQKRYEQLFKFYRKKSSRTVDGDAEEQQDHREKQTSPSKNKNLRCYTDDTSLSFSSISEISSRVPSSQISFPSCARSTLSAGFDAACWSTITSHQNRNTVAVSAADALVAEARMMREYKSNRQVGLTAAARGFPLGLRAGLSLFSGGNSVSKVPLGLAGIVGPHNLLANRMEGARASATDIGSAAFSGNAAISSERMPFLEESRAHRVSRAPLGLSGIHGPHNLLANRLKEARASTSDIGSAVLPRNNVMPNERMPSLEKSQVRSISRAPLGLPGNYLGGNLLVDRMEEVKSRSADVLSTAFPSNDVLPNNERIPSLESRVRGLSIQQDLAPADDDATATSTHTASNFDMHV